MVYNIIVIKNIFSFYMSICVYLYIYITIIKLKVQTRKFSTTRPRSVLREFLRFFCVFRCFISNFDTVQWCVPMGYSCTSYKRHDQSFLIMEFHTLRFKVLIIYISKNNTMQWFFCKNISCF